MPQGVIDLFAKALQADLVPFLCVAGKGTHLNVGRMIELLIAAVVIVVALRWDVDDLKTDVSMIQSEQKEFRKEMTESKVSMGDRWTASDQRGFTAALNRQLTDLHVELSAVAAKVEANHE